MKYQNLKSFQKHLSSAAPHNLCRVYLVAIGDDFERNSVLNSILGLIQTPDSFPSRFSGENFVLREFLDALYSPSLLGGEPIIILDEFEKVGKKELQPLLDQPLPPVYLLLGSRSKTPYAAAIEKLGVILDLTEEKPWDKEKRISEELATVAKNAGKRFTPEALQLLLDRTEKDLALYLSEVEKLICFVGEKEIIEREDVLRISVVSRSHTLWQTAEEVIWEGKPFPPIDSVSFHGLVPLLRSQLQIGLKIAALIEMQCPADEWGKHLPKMWPKALEKRSPVAARLGSPFFKRGLQKLLEIELLSRTQSTQYPALLDLFRSQLLQK